jgi:hypothetical protein
MTVKVRVAQESGEIGVYDGDQLKVYQVKDGEVAIPDQHLAAVLNATQGTVVKPEKPAKEK